MSARIVAIDWSGSMTDARRKIWLAEAVDGALVRLECGRDRDEAVRHLIELAAHDADLVVGLDFAFSMPSWFLEEQGCASAAEWWRRLAAGHAETLLRGCAPPFWGRAAHPRPVIAGDALRRTDRDLPCPREDASTALVSAKSVFQIGGAGTVGTGSLRGMCALAALRDAGFAIWPFDGPALPLALEIYPRLFTGAMNKSSASARRARLAPLRNRMSASILETAASTDDAFDAAVSALAIADHIGELRALPPISDPQLRLEGIIWHPQWCETLGR